MGELVRLCSVRTLEGHGHLSARFLGLVSPDGADNSHRRPRHRTQTTRPYANQEGGTSEGDAAGRVGPQPSHQSGCFRRVGRGRLAPRGQAPPPTRWLFRRPGRLQEGLGAPAGREVVQHCDPRVATRTCSGWTLVSLTAWPLPPCPARQTESFVTLPHPPSLSCPALGV